MTQRESEKLQNNTTKEDKCPVNKRELVNKHTKQFLQFLNSKIWRNDEPRNYLTNNKNNYMKISALITM
jgi:hypothetical protein